MPPPDSLQARLRAAREHHQAQRGTTDIEIPGWDGLLIARYRALSYAEARRIATAHERVRDVAQRELYGVADALTLACEEVVAEVDGERHPLGMGLGRDLATYLDLGEFDNDRQAVFAIFTDDFALVRHAGEHGEWQESTDRGVDRELAGNSPAAS